MTNRCSILVAVLCVSVCGGCASPLTRGVRAYDSGDYSRALAFFLDDPVCLSGCDSEAGARYALYRGLTHLSLGDLESAESFLSMAKAAFDRDPGIFGPDDRGRLLSAWVSIGREFGTWGRDVLDSR